MHSLIFATNNPHKVAEVKNMLPPQLSVVSLKGAGIDIDIPEPHDTLEANASEKSGIIYRLTGQNCVSEDTGLEVEALNGAPGVKSARFAGENANPEANIQLLILQMDGMENRKARFRTVISLWWQGTEYLFEGICPGHITYAKQGIDGFGYDPVFIPEGFTQSFAQMPASQKNTISHRAIAFKKFVAFMQRIE